MRRASLRRTAPPRSALHLLAGSRRLLSRSLSLEEENSQLRQQLLAAQELLAKNGNGNGNAWGGEEGEQSKFVGAQGMYTPELRFLYPNEPAPHVYPVFRVMDDNGAIVPAELSEGNAGRRRAATLDESSFSRGLPSGAGGPADEVELASSGGGRSRVAMEAPARLAVGSGGCAAAVDSPGAVSACSAPAGAARAAKPFTPPVLSRARTFTLGAKTEVDMSSWSKYVEMRVDLVSRRGGLMTALFQQVPAGHPELRIRTREPGGLDGT